MKPFTPEDLETSIPDFVIEAVNDLLKKNFNGSQASFTHTTVEKAIRQKMPEGEQWCQTRLNFEPIYREFGWDVLYDKPGYNESYSAYYQFTRRRNK